MLLQLYCMLHCCFCTYSTMHLRHTSACTRAGRQTASRLTTIPRINQRSLREGGNAGRAAEEGFLGRLGAALLGRRSGSKYSQARQACLVNKVQIGANPYFSANDASSPISWTS